MEESIPMGSKCSKRENNLKYMQPYHNFFYTDNFWFSANTLVLRIQAKSELNLQNQALFEKIYKQMLSPLLCIRGINVGALTSVAVREFPNAKCTRMVNTVAILGVMGVMEILKLCM